MDHHKVILPPTIPKKCRSVFRKKVELLLPDGCRVLCLQVQQYLKTLRAAAKTNRNLDLPLVEKMGNVLSGLLAKKEYEQLSDEHRGLLVGAARYFIETSDANDDLKDPLGFDDDLAVLNTVLLVIGRNDLVITRDTGEARRPRTKKP